ncbi:MAG: glycoside hydrolase family 2 [Streptococcaceae bacterium]|jgi:beta-galactosidase/beta-glucuronidase|nr:glycoside hydrolase family 2 [Streptococcaceae bacterium]
MKRKEYPRPQFVRENWINLNGEWSFKFDDENVGEQSENLNNPRFFDRKIEVPFVYQSKQSSIEERSSHDIVWYFRTFSVDYSKSERVILHFGAVDYEADIFINGQHVLNHKGGHTSFEVDVTNHLKTKGEQTLSVRAKDRHDNESQPRGKQSWEEESDGIWYSNSTGIWQTVWLEVVNRTYLKSVKFTPKIDTGLVEIEAKQNIQQPTSLDYLILYKGEKIAQGKIENSEERFHFEVDLFQEHIFRSNFHHDGYCWTPENPNLFEVELTLSDDGERADKVKSYFGMRKIEQKNGMIYLNNKPYYQKLVLDQGYWPEGLLTAPTDEDYKLDIKISKQMGFNGCRKHQKTEDPRFLYWADKLGYLVWGECAAAVVYNSNSVASLLSEWVEIIERDYNHPSIVTWVPLNESWGVPNISFDRRQQHFSQSLYHFIHSLDSTRLVVGNDGWAMTETDICSIHNYGHGQKEELQKYNYFKETLSTRENLIRRPSAPWPIFAEGFKYQNQAILLTEFGGIGYDMSGENGWGYTSVSNEQEFLDEYQRIMEAVYASRGLWGFCYTQITDVEQEINGLLTYDRKLKCDLEKIKKINDGFHVTSVE